MRPPFRGGWRATSAVVGVLVWGCSSESAQNREPIPRPPGPVAVEVEREAVSAQSVALIASAQGVGPSEAAEKAVFDAAFAAAARRDFPSRRLRWLTQTVLARAVWVDEWRKVRAQPLLDAEVAEATLAFWTTYARPEGRRTGHAVVRLKPDADEATKTVARATAQSILAAVRAPVEQARGLPKPTVSDEQAFTKGSFAKDPLFLAFAKAAKAATAATNVTIEELPSVAADARVIQRGAPGDRPGFDKRFVAGAWTLSKRGDLSKLVESDFGFHVIVLLEPTEPSRFTAAQRRDALREKIMVVRGKRARAKLLESLRGGAPIERPANHEALLGVIQLRSGREAALESSQ